MDNTKPLFSVIVPVYGVELYIRQCIDSILCQTFSDFELILVDDGSMDSCPEICDGYAKQDSRIHVIHKENGGLVTARQSGVALARGQYVACVDGDDWIAPDYLKDFAKAIDATGADIVCCGSVWWTSSTHAVKKVFPLKARLYEKSEIEKIIFPYLIEDASGAYFPNNLWAKVFTIQTYRQQQLSVNPSIKIAEDSACVKPCVYRAKRISVIGQCNYYYRQVPTSMTKKKKPFDWKGPEIVARHFEKTISMGERDFQMQVYRNCVHNVFNVAVTRFYQDKSYAQVKREIRENLGRGYYKKALSQTRFAPLSKAWLARFALKHKLYWLLKIFSSLK